MSPYELIELPYRPDSTHYLERLRSLGHSVWLDSGKPNSNYGRWDILSASPLFTIRLQPDLHFTGQPPAKVTAADTIEQAIQETRTFLGASGIAGLPFTAGLIGYWSYDLGLALQGLTSRLPEATQAPQLMLGCYLWCLLQDHDQHRAWLVLHERIPDAERREIRERLIRNPEPAPAHESFHLLQPFRASLNKEQYLAAIDRIHTYLLAGDCYQVNFAQHFSAPFRGDTWSAYRAVRAQAPSPFSAWLDDGERQILCFSPERFIKIQGNTVEARPIKGTRRRGSNREEDAANAQDLRDSAKDRAENLMIVDLLRNDLGRCCAPGSIRAEQLFALESFPNVHHLVSTITGELRKEISPSRMLMTAFPGGSITGAPKRRAMEIIEETEQTRRGLYCGSIGYLSADGQLDSNIVIRSLIAEQGKLHCWGGGGIVADSEPRQEYQESLDKIGIFLRALENL